MMKSIKPIVWAVLILVIMAAAGSAAVFAQELTDELIMDRMFVKAFVAAEMQNYEGVYRFIEEIEKKEKRAPEFVLEGLDGLRRIDGVKKVFIRYNIGNIRVTTITEGMLYIDGTRQGPVSSGSTTNLTDLPVGSYSLEMRYTVGEREAKMITVQKDRTTVAAFTYKLEIGDSGPAGGFVFYDKGSYSDGWRYLEAAPVNTEWNDKEWGEGKDIPGADGTAVGTGKQNTADIIAYLGTGSTFAAQLCDGLSYGGYDDWFLPSIDELDLMYNNLHQHGVGDFADYPSYWSSSERLNYNAECQRFSSGFQYSIKYNKSDKKRVRAVRAF